MFFFSKNKKQLKAIFDWLSQIVNQNNVILLEEKRGRKAYQFEFPLKFGNKPKRIKNFRDEDVGFYIKFYPNASESDIEKNDWQLLFQSPELEIYEHKRRFQKNQFKPLHRGLNEEEKKIALKIARGSLEIFLKEKRIPQIEDFNFSLPAIISLKSDLDVALWTKGMQRGSWVVKNKILSESLIEASISACRDARFKPLEADELPDTRIEITLISNLKIPLSENLLNKNEIIHNKGYLIKRGDREGWFLPEVFNVSPFKTLKEFLFRLGTKKALLQPEEIFDKHTEFFIFEVEDFIEGKNQDRILDLDGPIVQFKKQAVDIKKIASLAADWLLKVQEPDGNFIPVINPLTGKNSQVDWPRSIFAGWSLVEFGKAVANPKYIGAGRKNFSYAKKYVLDETIVNAANFTALNLAYLGQEALALNHWQETLQCGEKILNIEYRLEFEPIAFSQIGNFFLELSKDNQKFREPALRFATKAQDMFEHNLNHHRPIHFALWAELPNLHLKLFDISGENYYLKTARQAIDLFLNQQLDSGAFRSASDSDFVYTRGTGKITEALADIFLLKNKQIDAMFDLTYHKRCVEKSFRWLGSMQYSSENSYFIPLKNLVLVIGGFRNDYFNPELWIDAASHFLLAASRFLKAE